MYAEHSTASAKDFLEKLVRVTPFPIRMVQTDNGTEFINALLVTKSKHKTLFEEALMEIEYHRIRIATPRHNGKVEHHHRIDKLRFYKHMHMYSLEDGRKQLAAYQRASNDHIMTCLGMRSPNQVLTQLPGHHVVIMAARHNVPGSLSPLYFCFTAVKVGAYLLRKSPPFS